MTFPSCGVAEFEKFHPGTFDAVCDNFAAAPGRGSPVHSLGVHMPQAAHHRKCSWLCVGVLAFGIAGVAGTARILWAAFEKVMSGQGLNTYRTVWLVEFNYIGILVLFGTMILALIIGAGLWLHEWWQIRTLAKKYGTRKGNA